MHVALLLESVVLLAEGVQDSVEVFVQLGSVRVVLLQNLCHLVHRVVDGDRHVHLSRYLHCVVNAHAQQSFHEHELLNISLSNVNHFPTFIDLVDKLHNPNWLAIFALNFSNQEVFDRCCGRLVIDLDDEACLSFHLVRAKVVTACV